MNKRESRPGTRSRIISGSFWKTECAGQRTRDLGHDQNAETVISFGRGIEVESGCSNDKHLSCGCCWTKTARRRKGPNLQEGQTAETDVCRDCTDLEVCCCGGLYLGLVTKSRIDRDHLHDSITLFQRWRVELDELSGSDSNIIIWSSRANRSWTDWEKNDRVEKLSWDWVSQVLIEKDKDCSM